MVVIVMLVFTCLVYAYIGYIVERNNEKHLAHNLDLFVETIHQDVLIGANHLVYNKCKSFSRTSQVASVVITNSLNGKVLCEFNDNIESKSIGTTKVSAIYFDLAETKRAADVKVSFSNKLLHNILLNILVYLISAIIVITIILFFVIKYTSSKATKSIEELANIFNGGSLNKLACLEYNGNGRKIREVETLYSNAKDMANKIILYQNQAVVNAEHNAIVITAQQVSHDIRSPLTSLQTVITQMSDEIPEAPRTLIRTAVQRIGDIANDLSSKREKNEEKSIKNCKEQDKSIFLISALVDSLVSEKRMEYRANANIEILSDLNNTYGQFIEVNIIEIKRVLSNLVNNSVQAIEEGIKGKILVKLIEDDIYVKVYITDNGKGIPPHLLGKLGKRGGTYGKKSGQGLGLYHAMSSIEKMGGKLKINSEVGKGTSVTITLPKSSPSDWFVPEIFYDSETCVVIIDDDDSIHKVWDSRFDFLRIKPEQIIHFSNASDINKFCTKDKNTFKNILFLCDYEFIGANENGLDIIEQNNISDNSILVTSRYEEKGVKEKCKKLGVKLLPKGLAGFVPVSILQQSKIEYDAILIDDQPIVRDTWELVSKMKGKNFKSYSNPEEFFNEAKEIKKQTKVYIDSHLSEGRKGEVIAKDIKKLGFERIYLATGSSRDEFPDNMPWISGIRDKTCPFLES